MSFQLSTKVTGVEKTKTGLSVTVEPAAGGDKSVIEADVMLVSIGRRPYTDGLGLEGVGVQLDKRGRVITDKHYRTNVMGIYAIGDCREGPMLAHKAEDEAVACAELIAGKAGHVNYDAIPSVVYTFPEVATVGKSEEDLKSEGVAYKVGKFPFTANARAKTIMATDGFVKICRRQDRPGAGLRHYRARGGQSAGRSGAGDGVWRLIGRYRAHLSFPSHPQRGRPPGGDGGGRLDHADVICADLLPSAGRRALTHGTIRHIARALLLR